MDEILFCRHDEPYYCFANFSRHPIVVDGVKWPTTEHWYQAQKFNNPEIQEDIRCAGSPMLAATIGRTAPGMRKDWDIVKDDLMRKALRMKVEQNPDVKASLLGTGDRVIVENSPRDSYWANGSDGKGLNMLGKLWMELREELRKEV